jgi:hypothetical protein
MQEVVAMYPHPREPRSNWGLVHPARAPRPDPALAALPAVHFLGRHVKLAFPCLQTPTLHEHMWVEVYAVLADGTLMGRLDNDPVHNVGAVCGDTVQFTPDEIEAVEG